MPGRGQYWKKGGLIDETVKEEDLSQALQTKVNSGGGGGLFYASVVWGEGLTSTGEGSASFSPLMGVNGFRMGEQTDSVQGNFGRACKITNFVVRVVTHSAGTTDVELKKNGSIVKTYSFGDGDVGTTVTDSTETTFNSTDLISWDVSTLNGTKWIAIVEYDFS